MSKLDLITRLKGIEEALKRAPRAGDCRAMADRLAGVRSSLLMGEVAALAPDDVQAAMNLIFEAAHVRGVSNAELAAAFNAAGEKYPR